MKKYILAFAATFFSSFSFSQGFSSGAFFGLLHYHIVGTTNTSNDPNLPFFETASDINVNALLFGGVFKYDLPVYKFNDDMALGLGVNFGFGYQGSNKLQGIGVAFLFDFPEYITFRYGCRATKDSKQDLGYVFGLGYNYSITALPYQSPSVMGGIEFSKMSLLFNMNLLKYTYYYNFTSEGASPACTLRPFTIEICYHLSKNSTVVKGRR